MEIFLWILIVVFFIVSFIGLIYPIIPAILMIWGGIAIFHFFINPDALSWWTWMSAIILTILIFLADLLTNLYFVKKYGGSKASMRAATIGLIIGCFVIPPFGILIVPFILVFIVEMVQDRTWKESFKVSIGTLLAFLSSTFAKGLIQLTIIIIFLIDVLLG
ncbi:DUF456 domain-containing protein [Evansella tamaricis]|uniref:DUF456 domain-containing protein n=1 Tax=Evansella tamaricis TaxID=2069301 RepID=A0ABS6JDY7_9BACI|nr:DUF456 domain-containing protein [Evansella tamaricis]MBU9710660.1 DUF456 domain-containing protein [Evansella tamaricis]